MTRPEVVFAKSNLKSTPTNLSTDICQRHSYIIMKAIVPITHECCRQYNGDLHFTLNYKFDNDSKNIKKISNYGQLV